MFFNNTTFNYNDDIEKLGFSKLSKMYLENKNIDDKKYLLSNINKVKTINDDDIISVINYCAIYNRSYKQVKISNDETLFNSSYLNDFRIVIDSFCEKMNVLDSNSQYIIDNDIEYDYFDLIINLLKKIKNYETLSLNIYKIFDITILNDLKIFYKIVYTLLTNSYFNQLKCSVIYEVFHLKDILFDFLLKSNSNIDHILDEINKLFISIPTVNSKNLNKVIELLEIRSICCDRSLTFLNDGYKMMKFYNENNIFDYSAVSLQFFKVIEIEIKEKIIMPCSDGLNKDELFYGLKEILNLNSFNYDFIEKLELGKIRYLFRQVKSYMFDLRQEVEVTFINKDTELFYKRLISLLINVKTINFYLDILNSKVISLYRNSAVHTGVLSYERACESIEICSVFLKNLKELNYSHTIANTLNLKLYESPEFIKELIK